MSRATDIIARLRGRETGRKLRMVCILGLLFAMISHAPQAVEDDVGVHSSTAFQAQLVPDGQIAGTARLDTCHHHSGQGHSHCTTPAVLAATVGWVRKPDRPFGLPPVAARLAGRVDRVPFPPPKTFV